jgi:ABC-2 type transport system permease protein
VGNVDRLATDTREGASSSQRLQPQTAELARAHTFRTTAAFYRRMLRQRVAADASYRLSFVLRIFTGSVLILLDLAAIYGLFTKTKTIGGWNRQQVLFVYALATSGFRVGDAFIGGCTERIGEHVRTGQFDRFLTRPIRPFILLLGEEFALRRVMQACSVTFVLVAVVVTGNFGWNPFQWLLFVGSFISATIISASLFVIVGSLSFWSPDTAEMGNSVTYGGNFAAQYPSHIYPSWIKRMLFTVLPLAFVGYVPALALLPGVANPLNIARWISYCAPLTCIPVLVAAITCWRLGLRAYQSTGS